VQEAWRSAHTLQTNCWPPLLVLKIAQLQDKHIYRIFTRQWKNNLRRFCIICTILSICNIRCCRFVTGVAWAQILPRLGVWGVQPQESHCNLKSGNTFFRFKTSSYGLFKSNYNTQLILPLPLNMPDLFKEEKWNSYFNWWFYFTEATSSVASMQATPLYVSH
jgi:succinate-acetate transporter protein